MLPSNFSLKLVTLICPASFQLEYSPTFSLHLETTEQQNSPACVNTERVLKCLDQSRAVAHTLELQLCLNSFLNTFKLFLKCFLCLGLKSSLLREDLSKLKMKDPIYADLSLLKPTGPWTDLKIWFDHERKKKDQTES